MAKMLPRERRADSISLGQWETFSLSRNREGNVEIFIERPQAFVKSRTGWKRMSYRSAMNEASLHGTPVEKHGVYDIFKHQETGHTFVIVYSGRYEIDHKEMYFLTRNIFLK